MADETIVKNNFLGGQAQAAIDLALSLKVLSAQTVTMADYYDYYAGFHRLNFSSDKFRNKFGARLQQLNDNLCKVVVDAPASRLEVIGFSTEKKEKKIGEAAWEIWKRNQMPLKSKQVHREAFKCEKSYVIVWGDENRKARLFPQKAQNCYVWRDAETGLPIKGAKGWLGDDKFYYLTLYYPDRIEKYISRSTQTAIPSKPSQFKPREVEGEEFPLKNPLNRLPIIEFSNSESLLTDVIPLNDALNKSLADLFVGMEYNALRQRYITGIQFEQDEETGKPVVPFGDEDKYIATAAPDARIGEFSDSDLTKYLAVADSMRSEIARISGIPAHYFMFAQSEFPSGEAMRQAEARFTELIIEAQLSFGEAWAEVMSIALEIEGKTKGAVLSAQWSDAAPIGMREMLENGILKKQLGVSEKTILEEIGYTEEDVARMAEEKETETQNAQDNFNRAFDAGNLDATGGAAS